MRKLNLAFVVLAAASLAGWSAWQTHDEMPLPLEPATVAAQSPASTTVSPRPQSWAQPLERPGLPNLHQVAEGVYRGAQPTAEGFRELQKLGVKTVISLRGFHSDEELLKGTNLTLKHIPIHTWRPNRDQVVEFLKIVADKDRRPVFFHCQHGADRTGAMCASYRIVVDGWTKDEALREMTEGDFNFHSIWTNLIGFVKNLDVDAIRKEAGLSPPEAGSRANSSLTPTAK